ncbi:hypothetical protein Tco_1109528, partial [Tanacetum coccineum]
VDYSSSYDSDPSEDSLHVALELPLVSPILCSDDLEADSESEPDEQRPERHESLTPSFEFPLAHVVSLPGIRRRPTILVRLGEAIPFGRPYRTYPNRTHKLLTARKRVGPFPARRLAWRRVSHRSSDHHSSLDFTSDSSSSGSSLDSLSEISSGPSTRVASPRLVDPPVRTPRCSEAFMRWRSLDSSSPSVGPSRKRCRSPATLVPSCTPVSRSIAPSLADLPPRKRFRDLYSSEDSGEEHMEIGTAVADLGISDGVGAHIEDSIETSEGGTMEIEVDLLVTGRISEPTGGDALDLEGTLYDIAHYMSKVPLDKITEFETAQRQLETGQLVASRERASLADRVRSLGRENLRVRALLCIERDCVDGLHRHMALSQEEFRQIRIRRLNSLVERHLGFHR